MAMNPAVILCLLVVCVVQDSGSAPLSVSSSQQLKVSAFNIEILGVTKMGKPEVVEKLVEVCEADFINHYPVIAFLNA